MSAPRPIADNIMPPPPDMPPTTSSDDQLLLPALSTLKTHGFQHCRPSDRGALSPAQNTALLELLHADRLADREYLRTHPEVQAMVQLIVRHVERERPRNVAKYLGEYFGGGRGQLELDMQQELDRMRSSRDSVGGSEGDSMCQTPEVRSSVSSL